ncbi:MAG: hypothetical protein ACJ76P_04800, partial [Actinomycetota bacterium]
MQRDRIVRGSGLLLSIGVCLALAGGLVVPASAARTPSPSNRTPVSPASQGTRILHWSGYDWIMKDASSPIGPGPNRFSDSPRSVWVDDTGRLHLRIRKRHGHWVCSELWATSALG